MKTVILDWLPYIALFLLVGFIYAPVIISMAGQWENDANYSHGFLIPVLSLYLFWQRKDELNLLENRTNIIGLILLLSGLLFYVIGTAAAEFFTVRFSFVVVIAGMILYLAGMQKFKIVWFPILFLFFMIPLPYVLYYAMTFPMQLLSTKFASILLTAIGFPILRQGNIIHLPNYSLEVVEACSGLRSLMTLTALGAALAYMTQRSIIFGLLLFVMAVPVAIGANVFRIFLTAIGAQLISPKFAEGFLHEMSGILVFIVGFSMLGVIGLIFRRIDKPKESAAI
jgi:exosortase